MAQSDEAQKQLSEKFIVMGTIDLSYVQKLEETIELVATYEKLSGVSLNDSVEQLVLHSKVEGHND
ncbi:hypothetical protein [Olleya sp. HaHaR_3_96]|uniref:hypothetical protein n=1 Tax=Olleya sp. HaHaR_3_96 TaxID=2745560 RepID=UPI001C4FC7BA|nr:hypothetical protein [Olleya sp. HaHaR_3_96]QXP58272.1 hypothetical protein H0I26_10090 [Olleya sp. HaHaR_3_96]